MRHLLPLLLALTLTHPAHADDTPTVADDINALNEALQILLTDPGDTFADPDGTPPDITISLRAQAGTWSTDDAPLTDGRLSLPVDTAIALHIMAMDLIYEMSFPDLQLEFEAIPGRLEVVYIRFAQTGQYAGNCAYTCGSAGAPLVFDVRN
ncbi:hypothetical protein [Hasllibacter sp. MH4015]|uniref:hypothetical protein n=1 Tax=Hasllibacter sp. MH4015 TaxID=2854029 RepID=UPI001CD1E47A|nr:hypothetical protein [Hasllibacter sp. MH4015]